jgi:hypothetical protein
MQSSKLSPRPRDTAYFETLTPAADSMGEFGSEDGTVAAPAASPAAITTAAAPDDAATTTAFTHGGAWTSGRDIHTATRRWLIPILATLVVVQAPFVAMMALRGLGLLGSGNARLLIETSPSAIEVFIDGASVGRSPVDTSVAPGQRAIELRSSNLKRAFPITVGSGEIVRHRYELAADASSAAPVGVLQITTNPPGLTVSVDGRPRGRSPLTVAGLSAGPHAVLVPFPTGPIEQRVEIQAGTTAAVHLVTPALAADASGWLRVESPAAIQIFERGRLLGTTDIERLMLPAGDHVLDFGSEEFGFQSQQRVRIAARNTTTIRLDLPPAMLSLNATPWAEVWVDGERVGETPIGNLARSIGRHEVVFRHPELGERRETVTLRPDQPTRLSVDLRQRP